MWFEIDRQVHVVVLYINKEINCGVLRGINTLENAITGKKPTSG